MLSAIWRICFFECVRALRGLGLSEAIGRGEILAPAKSLDEMRRVLFNNQVDAALCALFMAVVVLTLVFAARAAWRARRAGMPTARETDYVALDAVR